MTIADGVFVLGGMMLVAGIYMLTGIAWTLLAVGAFLMLAGVLVGLQAAHERPRKL
jgi:uncharacterized membrane protein HdeD (DUF308 family)